MFQSGAQMFEVALGILFALLMFSLCMLCMQWMVDEKDLKVIHYTLGPLKPWDWWTAWLVKPVDAWQVFVQTLLALWSTPLYISSPLPVCGYC